MKGFGTVLTQLQCPALKFQQCLSESCLLLFGQPLPAGVLEHWEGLGIVGLHLRERWQLSHECDTSAVSAEEPWPCLRLFSLLLPRFSSFSTLLSISFLSPLFCLCVTHGNALTHLSTPLQTNHSVPLSLRCGSFPISFALLVSLHMY